MERCSGRTSLSPVIERTADDRYTTVIFVDEGISPPGELRGTLRLTAGGGLFHGMGQDTYRTEVREMVPPGRVGGSSSMRRSRSIGRPDSEG